MIMNNMAVFITVSVPPPPRCPAHYLLNYYSGQRVCKYAIWVARRSFCCPVCRDGCSLVQHPPLSRPFGICYTVNEYVALSCCRPPVCRPPSVYYPQHPGRPYICTKPSQGFGYCCSNRFTSE